MLQYIFININVPKIYGYYYDLTIGVCVCVHVRMSCVHAHTQIYVCQEENNGKRNKRTEEL